MIIKIRSIESTVKLESYSIFIDTNYVAAWAIKYFEGNFKEIKLFLISGKVLKLSTVDWKDSNIAELITALSRKQQLANTPTKDNLDDE